MGYLLTITPAPCSHHSSQVFSRCVQISPGFSTWMSTGTLKSANPTQNWLFLLTLHKIKTKQIRIQHALPLNFPISNTLPSNSISLSLPPPSSYPKNPSIVILLSKCPVWGQEVFFTIMSFSRWGVESRCSLTMGTFKIADERFLQKRCKSQAEYIIGWMYSAAVKPQTPLV